MIQAIGHYQWSFDSREKKNSARDVLIMTTRGLGLDPNHILYSSFGLNRLDCVVRTGNSSESDEKVKGIPKRNYLEAFGLEAALMNGGGISKSVDDIIWEGIQMHSPRVLGGLINTGSFGVAAYQKDRLEPASQEQHPGYVIRPDGVFPEAVVIMEMDYIISMHIPPMSRNVRSHDSL